MFLQIAEGVDDPTWLHHLRAGDYSRWLAESIKDPELASDVALIEKNEALDASESRARVKCKILDLRFHALPDEISACHSSLGGEFGEWIDVVKDASFARAGAAGAVHP